MGLLGFDNFADAFDGGGAGKSGDTFAGGPLSELLNALGIRPVGFGAREMGPRPMANPAYSQPRVSTSGPMAPPMGYAGRPDVPMGGGMPAAARPNTIGGLSMPGQPTLTPEQIQQLLMALGMMPQAPMSTPPMGSAGGNYDNMYRGAMIPPTSLGYGPR
jgi:hypothetical protein